MFRSLGPGLLISAALALAFRLSADTGGVAEATLTVAAGGPIGGAGGVGEPCTPVYGPPLPSVQVTQGVSLFHDVDGDGLLDPGDMLAYSAEVENLSPRALMGLRVFIVFHGALSPLALPDGWRLELGAVRALDVGLPPLAPYGKARVGFTARFEGEGADVATVFVRALLYGEGLSVAADDPATAAVLDPLVIAVREEVGGAAALSPGRGALTKEVTTGTGSPSRLVSPGDTVEFRVSYTAAGGGTVELVDFVPPPLRLLPGTLSVGEAETVGGRLTLVRARFTGLAPGARVSLRYRAEVGGAMVFPFLATRALAILPGGEVIFSDDPETEAPGDPTALLFPWTYGGWPPEVWEEFSRRARCVLPVIVRAGEGREDLRWVLWGGGGPGAVGPDELVLAELLEVPPASLAGDADLGFLLTRVPPGFREAYVPGVYGAPVFVPLSEGAGFVRGLKGPFCGNIYLPLLVRSPLEGPVYLTGVVVDEDT